MMKKLALALAIGATSMAGVVMPGAAVAADQPAKAKVVAAAPASGMGQIVFFRPGGMGGVMGCGVNENGERVSALGAGKYFIVPVTPGAHDYTVKSEAKDTLAIEVEAGETYYVMCKIKMGVVVGRPNLSPATAQDFDKVSHKLKLVDADDFGPKKAKGTEAVKDD